MTQSLNAIDVLVAGVWPAAAEKNFAATFTAHRVADRAAALALPEPERARIRAIAGGAGMATDAELIAALPNLEIIANFGVGYDGVDTTAAAARGIVVTNTPGVLTEEVADSALALLLMTVRELGAAERYLRAGKWIGGDYRLTDSLRNRKAGIVGYGRIGSALARRLDAMQIPVCYHSRNEKPDAPYPYHADLIAMAKAVDTLICILPGGAHTQNLINAEVLAALGATGVLINIGRGSSVDEPALIAALSSGTIHAAGLDVFAQEPKVPEALLALDNAVLLPHIGSGTHVTRDAMAGLVLDNLAKWFVTGQPVTPVPEAPVPETPVPSRG